MCWQIYDHWHEKLLGWWRLPYLDMTLWSSAPLKCLLLQEAFPNSPRPCAVPSSGLPVTVLPALLYRIVFCLWYDYVSTGLWASEGRDCLAHPRSSVPRAWRRADAQQMPVNLNGTELPAYILSHQARHFQGGRAGARLSCRRLWTQPLHNLCCAPSSFWESTEIPG